MMLDYPVCYNDGARSLNADAHLGSARHIH